MYQGSDLKDFNNENNWEYVVDQLSLADFKQSTRYYQLKNNGIRPELLYPGYYNYDGNINKTNNARNTGLIDIEGATKVIYSGRLSSGFPSLSFFDKNKKILVDLSRKYGDGEAVKKHIELTNIEFSTAKYIAVSTYDSTLQFNNFYCLLQRDDFLDVSKIEADVQKINSEIIHVEQLKKISILTFADFKNKGYINIRGEVSTNDEYRHTDYIYLTGKTNIVLRSVWCGDSSVIIAFYDKKKMFCGKIYNNVDATTHEYTIPSSDIPTEAVFFRCSSIAMDLDLEKTNILYSELSNSLNDIRDKQHNMDLELDSIKNIVYGEKIVYEPINVLIYGDSITDCVQKEIDINNRSTIHSFYAESNQYYNEKGELIRFKMWPLLIQYYLNCKDIRCYAKSGATFENHPGNQHPLQNLNYQIDVSFNDLANPNGIFPTSQFVPDIVIFAIGTNSPFEGDVDAAYTASMKKSIDKSGGGYDIDATLASMDLKNVPDAIHSAFLRVKRKFPMALYFVILPIQRTHKDIQFESRNNLIRKFAQRYSMIVIDGAAEMGIIRDTESSETQIDVDGKPVKGNHGVYLKDGLHPNDRGQNLYTRLVLSYIKKYWISPKWMNPL